MRRFIVYLVILLISTASGMYYFCVAIGVRQTSVQLVPLDIHGEERLGENFVRSSLSEELYYQVYIEDQLSREFVTYEEALAFARMQKNAYICDNINKQMLWDNYMPYNLFLSNDAYTEHGTFADAVEEGRRHPRAFIYHRKDQMMVWSNMQVLPLQYQIENVPMILQRPELMRGCEVTSLAMLLNFKKIEVDKMTLAQQIDTDWTPKEYRNGVLYWGDPNQGFVGNMENAAQSGFGVYHQPVHRLMEVYFPRSSLDLTGCEFEDLLFLIQSNQPVWVITNTSFAPLPPSSFVKWQSNGGEIVTTYKEHSVLITGYDEETIYFNDPLAGRRQATRRQFAEAWVQMGRQALSVSQ